MWYAIGRRIHYMTTLTTSQARANLYNLVDTISTQHNPVQIMGKRHNAVLISAEDWQAINETLYLLSIPGMRKSLIQGMNTPVNKCVKKLPW
jgi:PHD/YefM family antitoxin component YafN of YafNO toxin-antitoxin module